MIAQEATRQEYAALAEEYEHRWRHYLDSTRARALAALEAYTGARVLDAACGSGQLLSDLARMHTDLHLTGLDASNAMLERAHQRLPASVCLVEGRMERLPFPDGSFDLLTCLNALHHCDHAARAIAEFRRVLVPGGRLVLVDWRRNFLMLLMKHWLHLRGHPVGHLVGANELRFIAEGTGFAVDGLDRFRVHPAWALMTLRARRAS